MEKKRVFLIGDSIRIGYCETVREQLADVAEVFYPEGNCQNSQNILICLARWVAELADPEGIDLVQFNCGHWDINHWNGMAEPLTSPGEYEKNIRKILFALRKYFPKAKIVFATTTPMNPDGSGMLRENYRSTEEIARYNAIATAVAKEQGIAVNDLFAVTKDWGEETYADYCHYTAEAFAELGAEVTKMLRIALEETK